MNIQTSQEVERFIKSLQADTVAKVLRTIDLLEKFGHRLGMPHSKKVANRIYELRVRGRQEVRIFYSFYRNEAHLLCVFIKKTDQIPQKEMRHAEQKYQKLVD